MFEQIPSHIMDALEEIQRRLQKYPQVNFKVQGNRITVLPLDESGFAVSLVDNALSFTVSFDGWHEEFDDQDLALNAFAFGLSDDCRLEVFCRGKFRYAWTVEEKDEDGEWGPCEWIGLNTTGMLAPPLFWLKKHNLFLQNTLLQSGK